MCYKRRATVRFRFALWIGCHTEENMLRNAKIFRLFLLIFLTMGFFANSLLPQVCFCGKACRHGLQGNAKTGRGFPFHNRCPGVQCKSCNTEDLTTFKASNAAHATAKLQILDTQFTLLDSPDYRVNIDFIKIFLCRLNKSAIVPSPPTYLQNLSLLL